MEKDGIINGLQKDIKDIKKQLKDIESGCTVVESEQFLGLVEKVFVRILRKEEEIKMLNGIKNSIVTFGIITIMLAGWIIFLIMFTEPI